ncbi:RDD domain containing protein [Frankia sp. Hr75.2]|nr:RDD domain containing protein [Frankia sp. Hr75.2]SQD96982.1 RDD domain containing protein [Parafrankia sp. Ea1.12]
MVGFGPRLVAYAVDAVIANLLVGVLFLVGVSAAGDARGLAVYGAFLLEELLLVAVVGQTIGMRLAGIRVIRVRDGARQSWPWIVVRTLLLALFIPIFIWDRDLRGTHDRAAGTVVVRDPVTSPTT